MSKKEKKLLPRDSAGSMELKGGTGEITSMVSCGDFLEIYKIDKTFRVRSPESIDPERTNPEALWISSPTDDVGSQNKIIARVLIQGHEIINSAGYENELKESVTIKLHACKEALISCEKISNKISKSIDEIVKNIQSDGIKRDNHGRGLNPFPQVQDLEHDCGTFLVYINRAIKNICELPSLFLPLDRVDSNFDHLGKRLERYFKKETNLVKFIFSTTDRIRYLISLR